MYHRRAETTAHARFGSHSKLHSLSRGRGYGMPGSLHRLLTRDALQPGVKKHISWRWNGPSRWLADDQLTEETYPTAFSTFRRLYLRCEPSPWVQYLSI